MGSHNLYLTTSAEGIIRTLRDQFRDRWTFLGEALQNSRRAGASLVDLHFDPNELKLEIRDDGEGIEDFEKLLTLGESGWDLERLAAEYPYGVGFASMLFAADFIRIRSGEHDYYPGSRFFSGIGMITKLSSGGYIDDKGNTYRLLREAKEGVFAQVKTLLVHLIGQMNQRIKEDPTGQQELTLFEYASLETILDGMLNQVLANLPSLLDQHNIRCPPWRAKRRRVVPGRREATRGTRRAEGAKGDPQGSIRTRRPVIWETGV